MKLLCAKFASALALFTVLIYGKSAFLHVENKLGDYWIFRFNGQTINVTFDVDRKSQKQSDREANVSDLEVPAQLTTAVFRAERGNLAKLRLSCKRPGCVYSHFDSNRYDGLDIVCEREQDCVAFAQALP